MTPDTSMIDTLNLRHHLKDVSLPVLFIYDTKGTWYDNYGRPVDASQAAQKPLASVEAMVELFKNIRAHNDPLHLS